MIKEKYKNMLREMVENKCQLCNRHEDECGKLEVHRILRGNQGGKYHPNNILMLCSECHKNLHGDEF